MPFVVSRGRRFIDDLDDAYAFLAARSPASANRLLERVSEKVDLLSVFPRMGAELAELSPGLRVVPTAPFRYLILYRFDGSSIRLVRFLHAARDSSAQSLEDD